MKTEEKITQNKKTFFQNFSNPSIFSALKIIFVLLLFVTVFFIRISMLHKSSEPNGLDGYFYALQARSFVETGHLENLSYEPGYYLCGICSFFTKNAIEGVKIWAAISSALISLGIFLVIFSLTKNFIFSITGFLLASASPVISSMSLNYINNQTGIFFLLFYAFFLIKFLKSFSKKWIFPCAIFFILSAISHKVTMIYSIALTFVILLPFIKKLFTSYFSKLKKFQKLILIFLFSIIFIFVCIAGILFFRRHSPRFINAFSLPSLPFMNHRSLAQNVTIAGTFEITFYYIALYILGIISIFKKSQRHLILLIPVLFFPFLNLESDMGTRLFTNAVPLAIPFLIYEISLFVKFPKTLNAFFCICLLAGMFFTPHVYNPKNDPPYSYYRKIVSKVHLEEGSLLIAHLGLNHVYTYYNGLQDALNWLPDFEIPIEKTWRLAYGADYYYLVDFLEERNFFAGEINSSSEINSFTTENSILPATQNLIQQINADYVLLREDLWQFYLENEDEEIAETYKNWYNPYQVRPAYIRKIKSKKAKK